MSSKQTHVTWNDLESYCLEIIRQITASNWKPDIIVGVTRGGAVPAVMISHFLKTKMVGLDVSLRGNYEYDIGPETNAWLAEDACNGKNILVVDDINDSGDTINWIINDWACPEKAWGENVRVATIFDNESSFAKHTPDYSAVTINKAVDDCWVVFPYEEFWMPKK